MTRSLIDTLISRGADPVLAVSIEDTVNTEIRNARRIFDTVFDLTSQQDIERIESLPKDIRNGTTQVFVRRQADGNDIYKKAIGE